MICRLCIVFGLWWLRVETCFSLGRYSTVASFRSCATHNRCVSLGLVTHLATKCAFTALQGLRPFPEKPNPMAQKRNHHKHQTLTARISVTQSFLNWSIFEFETSGKPPTKFKVRQLVLPGSDGLQPPLGPAACRWAFKTTGEL